MDINRFKKPAGGIDKRTWDTWLSDDVRPTSDAANSSAAVKPLRVQAQSQTQKSPVPAAKKHSAVKPNITAGVISKPKTVVSSSPKSDVVAVPKPIVASVSSHAPLRRSDYQRRYVEGRSILEASTGADADITQIARSHKTRTKSQSNPKSNAAISVNIQLPQLPKVRVPEWRKLPWQALRPWAFALGLIVFLVVGGSVYSWWQNGHKAPAKVQTISATKDMGYKPYTPAGKTVATFGQYDPKKKLYTFNDAYMGSRVTVNQQTIPDKLRDDKAELQKLIDSVGAAESFTTSKGEVYVATDLATGSQRLVLIGTNLLVFIQSTATLENASWVKYLSTLQ